MKAIQEAITGKKDYGDLSSPYQALVQFYCVYFERSSFFISPESSSIETGF